MMQVLPPAPFNIQEIGDCLPHSGAMVLLDRVDFWDQKSITCQTNSHLSPTNPLLLDGKLPAITGIEYGAQALAVHAYLIDHCRPKSGYLASVRDLHLDVERFDQLEGALIVQAEMLAWDDRGGSYRFSIQNQACALMGGRLMVMVR